MTVTSQLDVVQRLLTEKPSFHMSGTARWDALPGTLRFLGRATHPDQTTLEVGAGVSTVIFAAAGAHHTAISPDPAEHRLIREYCDRSGIDDCRVTFIEGYSEDVLPTLLNRNRTLDLAFIDGNHSYPAPVIDWFYVARSLKCGGTLVLDDIVIPAAGQAYRHMRLEPTWRVAEVLDNRAAALTLVSVPSERDDWMQQPFNRSYPDFSFASLLQRAQLKAAWQAKEARTSLGRRLPILKKMREVRSSR